MLRPQLSARGRLIEGGPAASFLPRRWTGGRVAEGARLESVLTGNRYVGSNPTLSAHT